MRNNVSKFVDARTGEVNATELAEQCAGAFEVNDEGGPLDDSTHPIWDWAVQIGEEFEGGQ